MNDLGRLTSQVFSFSAWKGNNIYQFGGIYEASQSSQWKKIREVLTHNAMKIIIIMLLIFFEDSS